MTNKHLFDFKNPHFWRLLINFAALAILIEVQRKIVLLLGFYYGWIYLCVSATFSFLLTKGLDWLALAAIQHYVIKKLDETVNGENISYVMDCTRTSHSRRVELIIRFLDKYEYITSTWMYEMCPPNGYNPKLFTYYYIISECGTMKGLNEIGKPMLERFVTNEKYQIGCYVDIYQLFNPLNKDYKQLATRLAEIGDDNPEIFRDIVFFCNLMFLMTGDYERYLCNLISYIGNVVEVEMKWEEKTVVTAISSKNVHCTQYIVNMLKTILRNHIDGVSEISAEAFIFIRGGLQFYKKQSSRDDVIELDSIPSHYSHRSKK